jgi:hypothetical protein
MILARTSNVVLTGVRIMPVYGTGIAVSQLNYKTAQRNRIHQAFSFLFLLCLFFRFNIKSFFYSCLKKSERFALSLHHPWKTWPYRYLHAL